MALPDGLTIQDDNGGTFNKLVYFQSDMRVLDPKNTTVLTTDGKSYSFNVTIHLNLGEQVIFSTNWTALAVRVGTHNLTLLALSDGPQIDPNFKSVQAFCDVQVVEGIPVITGFAVVDSYSLPEIDPQAIFIYPNQDVTVGCNASSIYGIKNVTAYYSTDQSQTWVSILMNEQEVGEWIATLPRQTEGETVHIYAVAFDVFGGISRTEELVFQVQDSKMLDIKSSVIMASTVTTIAVGCAVYLLLRRRKSKDVL